MPARANGGAPEVRGPRRRWLRTDPPLELLGLHGGALGLDAAARRQIFTHMD
jgi:hypothetical protein